MSQTSLRTPTRGVQSLFGDLITEYPLKAIKGRSDRLDRLRDQCLVERYIYLMNVTGWRYDIMLRVLSTDFFLSERRVVDVLGENKQLIKEVRQEGLSKKDLQIKWPQFYWEKPELSQYF